MAYRFRERGGLVAAGRFAFLRCVALAVGKSAQARKFLQRPQVAGLVCTAPSYGISQFCGSTVIAWGRSPASGPSRTTVSGRCWY